MLSPVENELVDIFGKEEELQGNRLNFNFTKKPAFGRYPTLVEDLIDLRTKWRGKPNEVLVQHMIDSLIIFNYNRKHVNTNNGLGDDKVWTEALIQTLGKK